MKCHVYVGILAVLVALGGIVYNVFQDQLAEAIFIGLMRRFTIGKLCMVYPDGKMLVNGFPSESKSRSICDETMIIRDKKAFAQMIFGGFSLGFGEAYAWKWWDVEDHNTDDLPILMLLIAENAVLQPGSWVVKLDGWKPHVMYNEWLNSRKIKEEGEDRQDNKHIYDVGDDFYESFLDKTLMYTCGIWKNESETIEDAQQNKRDVIFTKLNVQPNQRILDVGSGWGNAVFDLASRHQAINVSVTGITLSKAHLDYSVNSYVGKGKDAPQVDFMRMHYRELMKPEFKNRFDGVFSIGMSEHIHIKRMAEFFQAMRNTLKEGGKMVVHFITANDVYSKFKVLRRERACVDVSYTTYYHYPGCCVIPTDWVHEIGRENGFTLVHKEFFGLHYARTLKEWRKKLVRHWDPIEKKYGEEVVRSFEFNFAFLELGMRMQRFDLVHMVWMKNAEDPLKHVKEFDYNKIWGPYYVT